MAKVSLIFSAPPCPRCSNSFCNIFAATLFPWYLSSAEQLCPLTYVPQTHGQRDRCMALLMKRELLVDYLEEGERISDRVFRLELWAVEEGNLLEFGLEGSKELLLLGIAPWGLAVLVLQRSLAEAEDVDGEALLALD